MAHGLRTSLLPELEAELGKLQQQLREAGSYSGPVFQAPPPALIPPTPARANHAPSLAVPPTPAFAPPRSTVAQTPAHAPQRMPSKISDSVRRAVHSKNARQAHQRGEGGNELMLHSCWPSGLASHPVCCSFSLSL